MSFTLREVNVKVTVVCLKACKKGRDRLYNALSCICAALPCVSGKMADRQSKFLSNHNRYQPHYGSQHRLPQCSLIGDRWSCDPHWTFWLWGKAGDMWTGIHSLTVAVLKILEVLHRCCKSETCIEPHSYKENFLRSIRPVEARITVWCNIMQDYETVGAWWRIYSDVRINYLTKMYFRILWCKLSTEPSKLASPNNLRLILANMAASSFIILKTKLVPNTPQYHQLKFKNRGFCLAPYVIDF